MIVFVRYLQMVAEQCIEKAYNNGYLPGVIVRKFYYKESIYSVILLSQTIR